MSPATCVAVEPPGDTCAAPQPTVLEEARRAFFTNDLPAVTEVTANQLSRPETDFEIDVIAVVD